MATKKQKLVEYLYPTQKLMDLMCKDEYQELLNIIPISKCISCQNASRKIREQNFECVKNLIIEFLKDKNYRAIIFDCYKNTNESIIVYNILLGLVFYMANTNDKYRDIDILADKKSICYDINSILNFL